MGVLLGVGRVMALEKRKYEEAIIILKYNLFAATIYSMDLTLQAVYASRLHSLPYMNKTLMNILMRNPRTTTGSLQTYYIPYMNKILTNIPMCNPLFLRLVTNYCKINTICMPLL